MPRYRESDDLDLVPIDPSADKSSKELPPAQWPVPEFNPREINNPLTYGQGNLPSNVKPDDPYAIFSLFFNEQTLQILVTNTNKYAEMYPAPRTPHARPWQPTTIAEFRAYIGVYIWIGVHPESSIETYWSTDSTEQSMHLAVTKHISLVPWQQIDRFFHISTPQKLTVKSKHSTFEKLEPLSEHLREQFKKYWTAGTHLTVDETIQRFMGRAKEIVNIPTKPEPEGFKIWVLANCGYVLDWLYHCKGDNKGPVDLNDFFTKELGFPKTQAVVLDLLSQHGISDQFQHIVWLDNLFTSVRLLTQLEDDGFGAAGTVRTTRTKREVKEAKSGTKAQQKELQKEHNRGLDPQLSDLKIKHNVQLEWGKLYACLSEDERVLEFAWKDQNVVLFMSTVSNGRDTVTRLRRRPTKTATNARTSRAPFQGKDVKELDIPEFIDMYNHFMNGVDVADQLRSYYTTQRTHFKTWKPLWHFLLDTTVTNAYKIAHCTPERPNSEPWEHFSHKKFRSRLASQLFAHSERLGSPFQLRETLSKHVHPARESDHGHIIQLDGKRQHCMACICSKRRSGTQRATRVPLAELSANSIRLNKRRERPPYSNYGCALCKLHLCNKIRCWREHIEAIPNS